MFYKLCAAILSVSFAGVLPADHTDNLLVWHIPTFMELDTDGNGSIDRNEAAAFPDLERIFPTVDNDGNGLLLLDEYRTAARRLQS